jgi:hypothetical protein
MRHEIEELRHEAEQRLEHLIEQFDELKAVNQAAAAKTTAATSTATPSTAATTSTTLNPKNKKATVDKIKAQKQSKESSSEHTLEHFEQHQREYEQLKQKAKQLALTHADPALLEDTTWKIVFNIGREKSTWMPQTWGASGDRLLFQTTVTFTSDQYTGVTDEFFQQESGTQQTPALLKKLIVEEGFVIPRGVGIQSVGRRPLPAKREGGYMVCPNQGPAGTDIVRFFLELTENVQLPDHESDVYCPAGRVYGTCGYFQVPTFHKADELCYRDLIANEYSQAVKNHERLQYNLDSDERGFFELDRWKAMKDVYNAKTQVDALAKELNAAKKLQPEKSQLRLSKAGSIGLSKEGGACCKVHKGLGLEYHILGRIEVACVQDPHHDNYHDLYQ